jgi:hypothetical protein
VDVAWAAIAALVPMIVALLSVMRSVDLAYHVRTGASILDGGGLPRVDTYTFSVAGEPWLDQQWGAQVLLSFAHDLGGWATVKALQAVLVAASFFVVYLACRRRGAAARWAAALTLAGFVVASPTLAMRPQLIALPLFAVALWALAGRHDHPGRLWVLPVLAAATANLHGSFTMYPLLGGLAWLDDATSRAPTARRTLVVTLLATLATLANPFGIDVWRYAIELSTNPIIRETITEWAPVSAADMPGIFMVSSAVAVAVVLARRSEPARWIDIATLVVFFALAMTAARAIVWWSMVAPIVLAGAPGRRLAVPRADPAARAESAGPAFLLVGALVAAILALLPWWRGTGFESHVVDAPPGLTREVDALPAGTRLFVHQPWGSWFEFAVPDVPVFVDSRIELLPQDVWDDYGEVAFAGDGWREALERWQPDAIVANTEHWDLIPRLRDDPAWRVAYEDEDGVLFVPA